MIPIFGGLSNECKKLNVFLFKKPQIEVDVNRKRKTGGSKSMTSNSKKRGGNSKEINRLDLYFKKKRLPI
jgi:hypothetical protein